MDSRNVEPPPEDVQSPPVEERPLEGDAFAAAMKLLLDRVQAARLSGA